MAIETDDNARRIPAARHSRLYDRRVPRLRAARCRRQDRRRSDARRRSLRLGCARHFSPRRLRQAAQVRRLQPARQHQGARAQPRDRAGRRRQRHGPSGDDLRGQSRGRTRARVGRRLGRRAPLQPFRRRLDLRDHAGRAWHGRNLHRGLVVQLHGAVGRRRAAARHQSDRGRDSGRQRAAGRARHRDLGGLERTNPHLRQRGQADAGGLGDQP